MLCLLRKLFECCFRPAAAAEPVRGDAIVDAGAWEDSIAGALATIEVAKKPKKHGDDGGKPVVPEAITKQYQKVVVGDVEIKDQGVCVTSDVAVLGDTRISAGGTCITGNVLVFGDVVIDGKDGQTVNGTCITGSAIILGNAKVRGNVCVSSNLFVKGDIIVEGSLKVGGKACNWGNKDVRPLPPS